MQSLSMEDRRLGVRCRFSFCAPFEVFYTRLLELFSWQTGVTQNASAKKTNRQTNWLIVTDLKDMDYELTTINVFAGILYSSLLYWRS
jgi:hypothetical protein